MIFGGVFLSGAHTTAATEEAVPGNPD